MKIGVPRPLLFTILLIACSLLFRHLFNVDSISYAGFLFQPSFTEHTVAGGYNGAAAVYAIDLDGDGDMDILGAANIADDITWWENNGSESFTKRTIDGNFNGARGVHAADVDGDGDLDVLGAAETAKDIAWWENDGTPADGGWTEHTVTRWARLPAARPYAPRDRGRCTI